MKTRFVKVMTMLALLAGAAAAQLKYVAVVETEIDASSGAAADLSSAEAREITAELRREAVKNLPRAKYNVMTSETVYAQGGSVLEECAEENCVITLGSKIGADYIVRGIIRKFKTRLTLTVEMYETEDGTLVASSDPVRSESAADLLEKTASACANMYKAFLSSQSTIQKPPTASAAPVTYAIATAANPPAGGAVSRNPNQAYYAAGANVNVMAAPAAGYKFVGWSGDASGDANPITVKMDDDKTLTANFQYIRTYTISPYVSPPGGGYVARNPSKETYASGEQVALTATPANGYTFTGWSGGASGAANTVTITADGNKYPTANFRRVVTYTLSAKANPYYGGYVSRNPEQRDYPSGAAVALTATPAGGYIFKRWSGASADTAAAIKITMDGNKELTAEFQALCTLSYRVHPSGGGRVNGDPSGNVYPFGTAVAVTAVPAEGYVFKGWSGAAADAANPAAITMTGNKTLTAKFYRPKTEEEIRAAKRTRLFAGAGLDLLGVGVFAYGLFKETQVSEQVGSGEYPTAEKSAKSRNAAYTVGSMILLSGISVHIFF